MVRLILVDHEAHVADMLDKIRISKGQNIWIATSPFAGDELKRKGIEYQIPENFFASQELIDPSRESLSRVKNIVEIGDTLLEKEVSTISDKGLTPFLFRLRELFMVHSGTMAKIFQIHRLFEKITPDEVWAHTSNGSPFGIGIMDFRFNPRAALWGRLLELEGWQKMGIRVKIFPETSYPDSDFGNRSNLQAKIKSYVKFPLEHIPWLLLLRSRNLCRSIDYIRGGLLLTRYFKNRFRKCPIAVLFTSLYYNWEYCFELFLEKKCRTVFLDTHHFLKKRFRTTHQIPEKELLSKIESDSHFRENFLYKSIDFYPFLKSQFEHLVKEVQKCVTIYDKVNKLFRRTRPDAVCTTSKNYITFIVSHIAQQKNIPVFDWQHGIAGSYGQPTLSHLDLFETSYYFAFGQKVISSLKDECRECNVHPIPIGSPSLESIEELKPRQLPKKARKWLAHVEYDRRLILYVTTNLMLNDWYGGYNPPFSDNYFSQSQKDILIGLLNISKSMVIVKLHPYLYGLPPWIEDLKNDRVLFIRDEISFAALINLAGGIVIDWPTTTVLQAVTTKKPVFVLTRWLELNDEAYNLLKKRAVCSDNEQEIIDSISRYVEDNYYPANVNNDEFLRGFGTYLKDGKSAERAVDKVLEVIRKSGGR